jgi:hypothetical protein
MDLVVAGTEVKVSGRFFKLGELRHEWFEFLSDPTPMIRALREHRSGVDLLSFLGDTAHGSGKYSFYSETASAAVLTVTSFDAWCRGLDFKVRNKIRKAEKSGVELRVATLDDDFARGVEQIYNESPVRQGMRFWHYGKSAAAIKQDLSSFPDRTSLIGAYFRQELIGFMKLFEGNDVLRTVHIIAKLSHRDKPVQDALIAKAVGICEKKSIHHLHYGNWSSGGLGAFKIKHGFERVEVPRYFVPITYRGTVMLKLNLHRRVVDQLPPRLREQLVALRARWNSSRHSSKTNVWERQVPNRPNA